MKITIGRSAACLSAVAAAILLPLLYFPESPKALGAPMQQSGLPLSVMFDGSILDANTKLLYQAMQNTINGYAVTPVDRTTYFSAVNNVNGYVVNGWQGIITSVQPNANGHLVSVDIIPGLSSDGAASAIIVDSDYSERYQVFPDGTFQYAGAFYNPGSAGQMPSIIGF